MGITLSRDNASAAGTPRLPALPLDPFRGIATGLLIGLLAITVLAPVLGGRVNLDMVTVPPFDGRPPATLADTLFNYPAGLQRQPPEPPGFNATINEPGLTDRALRAIVADMQVERTAPIPSNPVGSNPAPVRDQMMSSGPDAWASLETTYAQASNPWGGNGLGVLEMLRAVSTVGTDRDTHMARALTWFDLATFGEPENAVYRYNWALMHLALGHYAQAAAALDVLLPQAGTHPEVRYYAGLAQLRQGEPQAAITVWAPLLTGTTGSNWREPAAEGTADAEAALGNAVAALASYTTLVSNPQNFDAASYDKFLRLKLAQDGPDATITAIRALHDRFSTPDPRFRYDEGRLDLLLGRSGSAVNAFRDVIKQDNGNDPLSHAALAQADLAAGNNRDAVTEAETVIRLTGGDPTKTNLALAYDKRGNDNPYQYAVGQAVLTANVVRAQALAAQGQGDRVRALAADADAAGAGGPADKTAWLRYYAGLILAAGGVRDDALAHLKPADTTAPTRSAGLLGWAMSLDGKGAHEQARAIVDAAGGKDGVPNLPRDAAEAAAYATLARKLDASGFSAAAAPFYRVAAAWEAVRTPDLGTSPVAPSGLVQPVAYRLAEADFLQRTGNPLAAARQAAVQAAAPAYATPASTGTDFGSRLPALATLILLLLHTVIPARRAAADPTDDAPTGAGVLGRIGEQFAMPLPSMLAGILAIIVGGLAWAWAAAGSTPTALLGVVPFTLGAALLAVGGQEFGHRLALRRERSPGTVTTRAWPLGWILALVGAPFGVFYGWLVRTEAGADPTGTGAKSALMRQTDPDPTPGERVLWRGWGALGPAARVMLAGLLVNVGLSALAAALYIWQGGTAWRALLLGNLAVLAFTAASERPADGWALWRRSPVLWLILFIGASAALISLLLGAW